MLGRRWFLILLALLLAAPASAQPQPRRILLRPARVFDGVDPAPHEGWQVLVRGERIEAAGPGPGRARRRPGRRPARHDPDAGHDRGPFAPLPPSL